VKKNKNEIKDVFDFKGDQSLSFYEGKK